MNPQARSDVPLLVVDDDRLVLLTLTEGLRQAGFRVFEADNGDDAILLARRHRPALALLDIRMQGLSGFDVAQHLKDYSRIPFIFLSAYADEATRAQASALGAAAFLSKPIETEALVETIARILASGPSPIAAPSTAAPTTAAPTTAAPTTAALATTSAPGSDIALAQGILMHRHGLSRRSAAQRLERMAQHLGQATDRVAADLVAAQETLALAGTVDP